MTYSIFYSQQLYNPQVILHPYLLRKQLKSREVVLELWFEPRKSTSKNILWVLETSDKKIWAFLFKRKINFYLLTLLQLMPNFDRIFYA